MVPFLTQEVSEPVQRVGKGQVGWPWPWRNGGHTIEGVDQRLPALHVSACVYMGRLKVSLGVLPKVPFTFICFYYNFIYLVNFICLGIMCMQYCRVPWR